MRQRIAISFIIALLIGIDPVFGLSGTNPVEEYLVNNELTLEDKDFRKIEKQIHTFAGKERSSYQLQRIFYRIHRKFLKHYTPFADMSDLVQRGAYDCVTGTILFAYVLDELGYQFEIRYTPYHMYLIVQLEGKAIMMEATDPIKGFVENKQQLRIREAEYLNEAGCDMASPAVISNLDDAVGLLYYNQAVEQFNSGEYLEAFNLVADGYTFIQDPMISELLDLAITHIASDKEYTENEQDEYISRYLELKGYTGTFQVSN